jgi:ketosteroid isomerase-like protein
MRKLAVIALLACMCSGLVSAEPPKASDENARVAQMLRQQAQDLGDAMVAGDMTKIEQIFAPEWVSLGTGGKLVSRETALANIKSGNHKLQSFELGPMDVQVFGDVAIIHGSVTEKRTWDGKDNSGLFLFMDVVEKRGDTWVIVRSTGARVK